MATLAVRPTGQERKFHVDEIIVSKTDLKGKITYANQVFVKISGFSERELLGQPHNIIRHPEMPRGVFLLLWERIQQGDEVFAAVLNMSKNGDHYWVLAHVTPTFDDSNQIIGYHSNRRVLPDHVQSRLWPVYQQMLAIEKDESNSHKAALASKAFLLDAIQQSGVTYDQFIFSLFREAK